MQIRIGSKLAQKEANWQISTRLMWYVSYDENIKRRKVNWPNILLRLVVLILLRERQGVHWIGHCPKSVQWVSTELALLGELGESLLCTNFWYDPSPKNASVAVAAGASQTKINIELSVTSEQTGGLSVLNKMLSLWYQIINDPDSVVGCAAIEHILWHKETASSRPDDCTVFTPKIATEPSFKMWHDLASVGWVGMSCLVEPPFFLVVGPAWQWVHPPDTRCSEPCDKRRCCCCYRRAQLSPD